MFESLCEVGIVCFLGLDSEACTRVLSRELQRVQAAVDGPDLAVPCVSPECLLTKVNPAIFLVQPSFHPRVNTYSVTNDMAAVLPLLGRLSAVEAGRRGDSFDSSLLGSAIVVAMLAAGEVNDVWLFGPGLDLGPRLISLGAPIIALSGSLCFHLHFYEKSGL